MSTPVLSWFDPANWPPCPILAGNVSVPRTYQLPPLLSETFEPYVAGPLPGQGLWLPIPGSVAPGAVVDATSLLVGANSAAWQIGGPYGGPGGSYWPLVTPIDPANQYRIRFVVRIGIGEQVAFGTEPFLDFSNGLPDLVGFATESMGLAFSAQYSGGFVFGVLNIFDQVSPGGAQFGLGTMGIFADYVVEVALNGGGAFDVYVNGGLSAGLRQMYTGNESISTYSTIGCLQAVLDTVAVDQVRITRTIPLTNVGTTVLFNGEVTNPIPCNGWSGCTITCAGPAFDATASVVIDYTNDGVNWFNLATIPGLPALANVANVGALSCAALRFTVALPNDLGAQGVEVLLQDRP